MLRHVFLRLMPADVLFRTYAADAGYLLLLSF